MEEEDQVQAGGQVEVIEKMEEQECEEIPKSPVFNRTGPTKRRYLQAYPESRRTMRSQHPKRKRTSFVYPEITKKSKKYCICQKSEDGRIYWQCETCRQWFHPECIGRDLKNEPAKFYCDQCQAKQTKKSDQYTKVQIKELMGCSHQGTGVYGNLGWWRNTPDVPLIIIQDKCSSGRKKLTLVGFKPTPVSDSKEDEHQRHHRFIKDPLATTQKERKMFGFGDDCFEDEAIEWIRDKITSLLTADLHPIRPATSARIVTVPGVAKHSRLYGIFMDYNLAST